MPPLSPADLPVGVGHELHKKAIMIETASHAL